MFVIYILPAYFFNLRMFSLAFRRILSWAEQREQREQLGLVRRQVPRIAGSHVEEHRGLEGPADPAAIDPGSWCFPASHGLVLVVRR